MTVCAEVNRAMQELTKVNYNSEQNNELTQPIQLCYTNDTDTILSALNDRNLVADHLVLMNIMTGVNSPPAVNIDDAKSIGWQ